MRTQPLQLSRSLFYLLSIGLALSAWSEDRSEINTFIHWKECQKDPDCNLVRGLCGAVESVNKASIKQFKGYVRRNAPAVDCAQGKAQDISAYIGKCIEGRCHAIENSH